MLKPFKINYTDMDFRRYVPIIPTGKYKFRTIYYTNRKEEIMYIEIKGGFMNWFTEWLREDEITFKDIPTVSEEIFKCQGG